MVVQGEHLPSSLLSPPNAGIVPVIPPKPLLSWHGETTTIFSVLLRTAPAPHLVCH